MGHPICDKILCVSAKKTVASRRDIARSLGVSLKRDHYVGGEDKTDCLRLSKETFQNYANVYQHSLDFRWRPGHGVLKANLLFLFDKDGEEEPPYLILIIEDCFIELCDENKLGKDFTFEVKFKTTGRSFTFAADSFKALERWVSLLTISPIEYIQLSKQSFIEQMEQSQIGKNGPIT